jgi:hypothetical protein
MHQPQLGILALTHNQGLDEMHHNTLGNLVEYLVGIEPVQSLDVSLIPKTGFTTVAPNKLIFFLQ